MSAELDTVEPSDGLRRQCRQDEEITWVVEKDMRTNVLGAISGGAMLMLFTGVFGFVFGIALAGLLSPVVGLAVGGFIAFSLPVTLVVLAVLNAKFGTIEYAVTDDRFIKHRDGVTGINVDAVPVNRARDAEYTEDLLDTVFGTGDVSIEGARSGDDVTFDDAPDADALLRAVREEIVDADTVDVENPEAGGN